MLENVDYHITDKCNLNCVSCNHFCPLVSNIVDHKSLETIKTDLQSLQRFSKIVNKITILGGEPTLHPNLNEILYLTRELFPNCNIDLTTNGTTWNKFENWKTAIIENNVHVIISSYPYSSSYKENEKHIIDCIGADRCTVLDVSYMQKGPLVLRRENTDEQILNCRMRGYCCQLKDSHLYICNYAAQIDYLYDEFPFLKNYIFREGYEKINLLDSETTEELIECMVYNSIPALCFYCNECTRYENSANMEHIHWKKSEKRIEEWIS